MTTEWKDVLPEGTTFEDMGEAVSGVVKTGMSSDEIAGALVKAHNNPITRRLNMKLKQGELFSSFLIQGDSTANSDDEWFVLAMKDIAAKFSNYNLIQSNWNITLDSYRPTRVIQLGSLGERYQDMDPALLQTGSCSYDDGNFDISNDLDVRVKASFDTWADNGEGLIMSRFQIGGERAWAFGVKSTGAPYIWWSEDGSALTSYNCDSIIPTAEGADFYIRCVFDVDNGATGHNVTFYTSSDDGETWDQLGASVDYVGVVSIFNGTADIAINGRGSSQFKGKFYHGEVLNGIEGEMIASPSVAQRRNLPYLKNTIDLQGNALSFNTPTGDTGGSPTIMLLNASASGMALNYSADADRFIKQTPYKTDVSFINYSHNEGGSPDYYTTYPAFIDMHMDRYPNSIVIPTTQNPKKSPNTSDDIVRQGYRCGLIAQVAVSRSLTLLDAYGSFLDTGDPDALVSSDGTHPTAEGFRLWADNAVTILGFEG